MSAINPISKYNAITYKFLCKCSEVVMFYENNKTKLDKTQRVKFISKFCIFLVNNMNKINPVSSIGQNCFGVFRTAIGVIMTNLKQIKGAVVKNKQDFVTCFNYCAFMIREYLLKNDVSNIISNEYLKDHKFGGFRRSSRINEDVIEVMEAPKKVKQIKMKIVEAPLRRSPRLNIHVDEVMDAPKKVVEAPLRRSPRLRA